VNDIPPPYDENNPEEVIRFFWRRLITIMRFIWAWSNLGTIGIAAGVTAIVATFAMFSHFGTDIALPFLADFVPMLIAIAGIIMSYRQPKEKTHGLTTVVLIFVGLVGTGVLSAARTRNDTTHKKEI
jgi:hypothetical protein